MWLRMMQLLPGEEADVLQPWERMELWDLRVKIMRQEREQAN